MTTVQGHFRAWRDMGLFGVSNRVPVLAARELEGHAASPTAGEIYSRSVITTGGGRPRGFDAGAQAKGRKRRPLGLVLVLVVHAAKLRDRDGAPELLRAARHRVPWLRVRAAHSDGARSGFHLRRRRPCERDAAGALDGQGDWTTEIIGRSDTAEGFEVLPRRRVAVRSFAWLGRCLRLAPGLDAQRR